MNKKVGTCQGNPESFEASINATTSAATDEREDPELEVDFERVDLRVVQEAILANRRRHGTRGLPPRDGAQAEGDIAHWGGGLRRRTTTSPPTSSPRRPTDEVSKFFLPPIATFFVLERGDDDDDDADDDGGVKMRWKPQ